MTRYIRFATPVGMLCATALGGALTGVHYEGGRHAPPSSGEWIEDPQSAALAQCRQQLDDYFAGKRQRFELLLAARGTPFQERVWREIARIPYGETITYAQLAARAGAPGSARAAGAATGRNPISIIVPCHRVLGADGSLTGYAGGLPGKTRLLEIEGVLQRSLA